VDVPAAIAVMQRAYRPRPYRGRAVVLTAAGQRCDEATRDAWTWWIAGGVEFVPLAGDAWQILRPPHVRDTAACIMARASP
jgi:thioesterase domain-containing protein